MVVTRVLIGLLLLNALIYKLLAQRVPAIIGNEKIAADHYIPDFSYAGYKYGEEELPITYQGFRVFYASDFGVIPNDEKDDSKALKAMLDSAHRIKEKVWLKLPRGRIILSEILYIERSHLVLSGTGSGEFGTVIYCPRPMRYFPDPPELAELREYLNTLDKRQRERENNLDLPFSQYSWSGGMIWTRRPDVRTKAYLEKYDEQPVVLTNLVSGKRGTSDLEVADSDQLTEGMVVQIEWFNTEGPEGSLIEAIYNEKGLKVGSHHWKFPTHALVRQPTEIVAINGNRVTIKDPLLHDINSSWNPQMTKWEHISEVGIEHIRFEFPDAPNIAHHIEEGYNAIYLTRLRNGWVRDVHIVNGDAGILTEEVVNTTIRDVETSGQKLAHYSVAMSGVHNVLAEGLTVNNPVRHPLSFNTFSTRSVYKDSWVNVQPILDQHSGANHQNLFDNVQVRISLGGEKSYPLFAGGGAGYWKPSHGAYTVFWNIKVRFEDGFDITEPIVLNGMDDGPHVRLVGVHANKLISLNYGPEAYEECTNERMDEVPSLYEFQLKRRLTQRSNLK